MVLSPVIKRLSRLFVIVGPGLVVMLADTDAGSVITAAQSGAQWGYGLLPFQILIIPVLYLVQELTVRLGLGTGKGAGELIVQRFGRGWAVLATATLAVSCLGALVTQFSGLAGIGQMFGIPIWQTVSAAVVLIFAMVWTGSYHSVERIAIFLGLFELAFLVVVWNAHPDLTDMSRQMEHLPLTDSRYLYLLAANLGTSIMPWTVFYQQSAIIDKGLGVDDIRVARLDTLFGAILCQIVTMAVLMAAAATIGLHGGGASLESVPQIAQAFTTVLGEQIGRFVFILGLSGGALVATIVVCLAAAWAVGEVSGVHHSLEHPPADALWFYAAFAVFLVLGGGLVASGLNLVQLSIAVGVVNALLLPVVLGFLFLLARSDLPEPLRLKGGYAALVGVVFLITSGLGLYSGIVGALG